MNEFVKQFEQATPLQMGLIGLLIVLVWFLPLVLALVFNRRQAKLIAIACVPAGLSVFAWSAVMVWAVTGKAIEKYLPEKVKAKLHNNTR